MAYPLSLYLGSVHSEGEQDYVDVSNILYSNRSIPEPDVHFFLLADLWTQCLVYTLILISSLTKSEHRDSTVILFLPSSILLGFLQSWTIKEYFLLIEHIVSL